MDHVFVFEAQTETDRERLATAMGIHAGWGTIFANLDRHEFVYVEASPATGGPEDRRGRALRQAPGTTAGLRPCEK